MLGALQRRLWLPGAVFVDWITRVEWARFPTSTAEASQTIELLHRERSTADRTPEWAAAQDVILSDEFVEMSLGQ